MGEVMKPIAELNLPPDIDTTGMTEEEIREFARIYEEQMAATTEGIEIRPPVIKINKDTQTFNDANGESFDEIRGVVVYKHATRGFWPPESEESENSAPFCASMDGITGRLNSELSDQELNDLGIPNGQDCATCPFNAWGSGRDRSGNPTRGKACKEMRRLYILRENSKIPSRLTIPPTGIKNHDEHFSARAAQGIPDLLQETVISLYPAGDGKFTYALPRFKKGNRIPPKRMIELAKMQKELRRVSQQTDIGFDEYMSDDASTATDDSPF